MSIAIVDVAQPNIIDEQREFSMDTFRQISQVMLKLLPEPTKFKFDREHNVQPNL